MPCRAMLCYAMLYSTLKHSTPLSQVAGFSLKPTFFVDVERLVLLSAQPPLVSCPTQPHGSYLDAQELCKWAEDGGAGG